MNIPANDVIEKVFSAFFTPPFYPIPEPEQVFAKEANQYMMDYMDTQISVYEWGKENKNTVLLVHGWGGRGTQLGYFVKPLLEKGYHVVAFDGTGHYESGSPLNFRIRLIEFAEIITAFSKKYTLKGLIAHSMGAGAATLALGKQAAIEKVVFFGTPRRFEYRIDEIAMKFNLGEDLKKAVKTKFETTFGADIWEETSTEIIAGNIHSPALFFHSPEDAEVPFEEGKKVADMWAGKVEFISTPGFGHTKFLKDEDIIRQAVDFIG